jgi:hypothetical protein
MQGFFCDASQVIPCSNLAVTQAEIRRPPMKMIATHYYWCIMCANFETHRVSHPVDILPHMASNLWASWLKEAVQNRLTIVSWTPAIKMLLTYESGIDADAKSA